MAIYFPGRDTIKGGRGKWLVEAVGEGAALRITAEIFPLGCVVYVPRWEGLQERRQEFLQLAREGRSANEIAKMFGCSNRNAYRIRKSLKKDGLL